MNYSTIENRFQEIDKKEQHVRDYYDAKSSKGPQHQYINDLRADFQYDTLIYGLGLF